MNKLYKILQNPYSAVINSKKLDFKSYGIDVEFKDEALKFFAKEAAKQKTGARALMTVVERLLINYEKVDAAVSILEKSLENAGTETENCGAGCTGETGGAGSKIMKVWQRKQG